MTGYKVNMKKKCNDNEKKWDNEKKRFKSMNNDNEKEIGCEEKAKPP